MTGAVRTALNGLLAQLANRAGIKRDAILELAIVGNPIMHHLVLGIDPVPLGSAPFALATDRAVTVQATELDLITHPGARAYLLPCIAGHVGADTAGVILAEAPHESEVVELVVDVGTNAEIVLEGYIDKDELTEEGPFGDHTGYYTGVEPFPVFHVTAMTMRRDAIYPSIIVGIPPQEDAWLGKATERLFLPALRMTLPELVDYDLPIAGAFHNLCIISIRKAFPGHARKVMHAVWGTGLMSLTKGVVVVDADVDVHDYNEVMWQVGANVDPERDVLLLFVAEAAVIGLAGGLIGTLIAVGLARLGNAAVDRLAQGVASGLDVFRPDAWVVVAALALAVLLSTVSGFLPAVRAALQDPVKALRYE
jgi:hypothetical protein